MATQHPFLKEWKSTTFHASLQAWIIFQYPPFNPIHCAGEGGRGFIKMRGDT
jgi:hypothetical protein